MASTLPRKREDDHGGNGGTSHRWGGLWLVLFVALVWGAAPLLEWVLALLEGLGRLAG